jgi:uncharacterized protein YegL
MTIAVVVALISLVVSRCPAVVHADSSKSVDMTVTAFATGSDVVETVVDLISQSCIFDNDRLLLRRIAYVETQDGLASNTFRHGDDNFYGGIWQISETDFLHVQASMTASVSEQIQAKFQIDWSSVQYTELIKPLYSGLAARLRIAEYYATTTIPQSVSSQASYWALHYTINTGGSSTIFVERSSAIITTCESPRADIVFVLDSSGSIASDNFDNVLEFVNEVVRSFDIGAQKVRIGVIVFSDKATVEFDLTTYDTTLEITNAVKKIQYVGGGTNSAAGIEALEKMVSDQGRQNDGVPVIGIFMTDGKSNDQSKTSEAARKLHSDMPEVVVFSVGVGSSVDITELDVIASNPNCIHVYQLSSFNDVTAFTTQIMQQSCRVPATLPVDSEVSGTIKYNQYYYFKITVHKQKKGVKIQIKTRSGGVKTYFSWKVHNPSRALYDYFDEVDSSYFYGKDISIPWDDKLSYNDNGDSDDNDDKTGTKDKTGSKDNDDKTGSKDNDADGSSSSSTDVTGTIYGALVGSEKTDNAFVLSYTDSATGVTGHFLTAYLMASLVSLYHLLK